MPVKPNFLERIAFYTLNAAPAPMLDLAGALAFQTMSTAVKINLFDELYARPATLTELSESLNCPKRGLQKLLLALVSIGYVTEKDGRYYNSDLTQKWFFGSDMMDMKAAVHLFNTYFLELWPHAPEVMQSGERPYEFYDFITRDPQLSHAFQETMVGNANFIGPDVVKKINLPDEDGHLLDVGGGQIAILDQLEGTVSGSAANALVQLLGYMFYLFANGRAFSQDEVKSMLNQTDFGNIQFHTSAKWTGTSLVTAVKRTAT